eukprot:6199648-Pleurochrysis_carterae.AAC.1
MTRMVVMLRVCVRVLLGSMSALQHQLPLYTISTQSPYNVLITPVLNMFLQTVGARALQWRSVDTLSSFVPKDRIMQAQHTASQGRITPKA